MEGHGDGRSGRRSGGGPRPRRAGPPFRALVHYLVVPARSAYQMLRTRCLVKGRWPKARGDREGEYERGALILSRPPAILWFLSHRWERNSPPAGGEISPPKQQISAGAAKSPARTSRSGASGRPRPTEEAKISGGGGGKPPPYSILLTMPAPQTVPSSAPFRGTWSYPLYLPLDKGSRPSRGRL